MERRLNGAVATDDSGIAAIVTVAPDSRTAALSDTRGRRVSADRYVQAVSFIVPSRFCGPPESGNGGWVSGHAAALLTRAGAAGTSAVTVRLRTPPPLDREMTVEADGAGLRVHDGIHLVLEATTTERLAMDGSPPPVDYATAEAVGAHYEGLDHHPFPTCFSCGTQRTPGDGLCLRPARVDGGSGEYACAWTPGPDVDLETVWAALDCPGGWSAGIAGRPMVLGTMTAQVDALPRAGEPHVVMAWQRGAEGRKHLSASALCAADGTVLAYAESTWIAIDPESIRPAGGTP
jgi:hypothetical protein